MAMEIYIGIASAVVYLFGGALILFMYSAYKSTKNFDLIVLALGLFLLIFGSNVWIDYWLISQQFTPVVPVTQDLGYFISLVFQIPGILLIFYSAIKPAIKR
jgi:hypothetical protein